MEETGEFVVNLAPEGLFERINATATDFPRGVSEFDACGVEREPSLRVKPPRVAQSPVALECELHSTLRIGDSTVVFGRVVAAGGRSASNESRARGASRAREKRTAGEPGGRGTGASIRGE
ncbi:hypothetical protein STANM309S_02810 [Streptomyces tanashiensis]